MYLNNWNSLLLKHPVVPYSLGFMVKTEELNIQQAKRKPSWKWSKQRWPCLEFFVTLLHFNWKTFEKAEEENQAWLPHPQH